MQILMSNTGMTTTPEHNTEQRLTDLEVKASFTEDLIEHLDQVVVRQQAQIDQLIREITHLREQHSSTDSAPACNLRDDLPPHF
jgi:SlyX protein